MASTYKGDRDYKDTDAYKKNKKLLEKKRSNREVNITGKDRKVTAEKQTESNSEFVTNRINKLPSPLKFPGKPKKPKLKEIPKLQLKGENKESYLKGDTFKPTKSKVNNLKLRIPQKVSYDNPNYHKKSWQGKFGKDSEGKTVSKKK